MHSGTDLEDIQETNLEVKMNNNINVLSGAVVNAAYLIHKETGPGLLESVYEMLLFHELVDLGFEVTRQHPIPIVCRGRTFDEGFRADLLVENQILLELKSVVKVTVVHKKQLLTYLKLSGYPLGLLINFGECLIKDGITRIRV